MLISNILKAVNKHLDDEGLSVDDILPYLDSAISLINRKCYAIYPTFSSLSATPDSPTGIELSPMNYNAIPDMWIYSIIIPFVCAKYKVQDDENPAIFIMEYEQGLLQFLHSYQIPTEYQDTARLQMLYGGVDFETTRNFSGSDW